MLTSNLFHFHIHTGLLHPFTPKGRLLWLGREAMREALALLDAAQAAAPGVTLARRNGILRPAQAAGGSGGGDEDDAPPQDASSSSSSSPSSAAQPADGALLLDPAQTVSKLPGLVPAAPGPSLFYPEGVALVVRGYLEALWTATRISAAARPGCAVRLLRERVPSLSEIATTAGSSSGPGSSSRYAAVVVAAGAAAAFLPELAALPVKTCGGAVVHLRPGAGSQGLPETAPGVLGSPYLVPTETGISVGATREWNVPPDDGFLSGASPVAAPRRLRAERELLPKAHEKLPLLRDWGVSAVEWGVRAQPPRTRHGRLPLIGRLPDALVPGAPAQAAGAAEGAAAAPVWVFVGLGARGIVYHALLGKALAAAVLDGDSNALPEETRAVWESALATMIGGGSEEQQQGKAGAAGGGKPQGGGSSGGKQPPAGGDGAKLRRKQQKRREDVSSGGASA